MDIVLVPGLWLDGDSWAEVTAALRAAGHDVHPVTLPGMESPDADRSGIGLADHVRAVVELVDSLDPGVVLVGHSGGSAVVWAAADARPGRVARVVHVDALPLGDGGCINDELPVVGGEIPLPDWGVFEPEDLVDLTDELRERFRAIAVPSPARVASDAQVLGSERRFAIPATVVCCEFRADDARRWMSGVAPWTAELARLERLDLVDLPTGHWPQFTRPADLARVILDAVG